MADESVIVSSAVVLPEDTSTTADSPTPSHKRRASSSSSISSKRPRIDAPSKSTNQQPSNPASRRGTTDIDERKRGKRLFGGLLGALAQNNNTPSQQRRRVDIERKQREKLKAQAEEDHESTGRERAALMERRIEEQKIWNGQARRTTRENEIARARFLKTTARPVIYYRPWELMDEEEDTIDRQIEEVEKKFADEVEVDMRKNGRSKLSDPKDVPMVDQGQAEEDTPAKDDAKPNGDSSHQQLDAVSKEENQSASTIERNEDSADVNNSETVVHARSEDAEVDADSAFKDGMDETGDDVVHGDEDAVLY